MTAIEYNKDRIKSEDRVEIIQDELGVEVDGLWGPKTVEAIERFQGQYGLAVDGKFGPKTEEVFHEVFTDDGPDFPNANVRPVLGLWMDSPKDAKKEQTWSVMRDHGITSVALMVEGHNEKWNPWYDAKDIERICEFAANRGMVVGVTDWPYPNPVWLQDAFRTLRPWFDPKAHGFPLDFYESDVEGNWRPKKVRVFGNLDMAGDELVNLKKGVVAGSNARIESTTFTAHTENGRAADVAPHMDRLFAQAYAVRGRKKQNGEKWLIPWNHTYGPGNMVKHTLDRTLQVPGVLEKVEMGCGLAAYDQKWPDHTAGEAMMKSFTAACLYGPKEIRWWSYKWLFGHVATSYGASFIKSVAKTQ